MSYSSRMIITHNRYQMMIDIVFLTSLVFLSRKGNFCILSHKMATIYILKFCIITMINIIYCYFIEPKISHRFLIFFAHLMAYNCSISKVIKLRNRIQSTSIVNLSTINIIIFIYIGITAVFSFFQFYSYLRLRKMRNPKRKRVTFNEFIVEVSGEKKFSTPRLSSIVPEDTQIPDSEENPAYF